MRLNILREAALSFAMYTLISSTSFGQSTIDFNTDGDFQDWTELSKLDSPTVAGGVFTANADPSNTTRFISIGNLAFDVSTFGLLTVDLKNNTLATDIRLRNQTDAANSPFVAITTGDTEFTRYELEIPGTTATSDMDFQLRTAGGVSNNAGSFEIDQFIYSSFTLSTNDVFGNAKTTVLGHKGEISVLNAPKSSKIEVFSIAGQTVGLKNLLAGSYIIRISAEGQMLVKKVMVY